MLKIEEVLTEPCKALASRSRYQTDSIKAIPSPLSPGYRKEATGGLDDAQLRELDARLTYLRTLEARKAEVLASIDEQGKLEELGDAIEGATMMQRVEDLYKPFKKKRATRASKARAAGLEPLANMIMLQATTSGDPLAIAAEYVNAEGGYATAEAALAGAQDIVAEVIADDAENTDALRAFTNNTGAIGVEAVDADEKTVYEAYYDFSEPVSKIPNHRILAINRGETEAKLRVRVRVDQQQAIDLLGSRIARRGGIFAQALDAAITDGYKRLMAPSLEREVRAASRSAPRRTPSRSSPRTRRRCCRNARFAVPASSPWTQVTARAARWAVLDEFGKPLDYATVYPALSPRSDVAGTKRKVGRARAPLQHQHHRDR